VPARGVEERNLGRAARRWLDVEEPCLAMVVHFLVEGALHLAQVVLCWSVVEAQKALPSRSLSVHHPPQYRCHHLFA
jgi:hypothetical protein